MNDLPGISAQQLSDLIGAIYDCALEPQGWPQACRDIAALCNSSGGGICVHDMRQTQNDRLFVFGYSEDFLRALGSQYAQSPMAAADVVAELGRVSALSIEQLQFDESRFFRDVLAPHGLQDILWFPALRTAGRMASLHASRGEKASRYEAADLDLFRLLAPHVCRALAISDALDIRTLRSEALERTLDGLASGVFLTTHEGRVVYMNAAAERQVRTGSAMRLVDNQLSPADGTARAALAQALGRAAREEVDLAMRGYTVPLPGSAGSGGSVATLLPVASGRRSGILAPFAATVAVFTQDPAEAPLMPGEAFARLHGLTGAELRVLLALAQGLSGMEAAEMLGISEPTVRTHLQRMYSKTGTGRQQDLLRLLHHSTPPLRAAAASRLTIS